MAERTQAIIFGIIYFIAYFGVYIGNPFDPYMSLGMIIGSLMWPLMIVGAVHALKRKKRENKKEATTFWGNPVFWRNLFLTAFVWNLVIWVV